MSTHTRVYAKQKNKLIRLCDRRRFSIPPPHFPFKQFWKIHILTRLIYDKCIKNVCSSNADDDDFLRLCEEEKLISTLSLSFLPFASLWISSKNFFRDVNVCHIITVSQRIPGYDYKKTSHTTSTRSLLLKPSSAQPHPPSLNSPPNKCCLKTIKLPPCVWDEYTFIYNISQT